MMDDAAFKTAMKDYLGRNYKRNAKWHWRHLVEDLFAEVIAPEMQDRETQLAETEAAWMRAWRQQVTTEADERRARVEAMMRLLRSL